MTFVLLGLFVGAGVKLFQMQVLAAGSYEELANGNRIREVIEYAPRGKILDRDGRVLAQNTLIFQLSVTPHLTEEKEASLKDDRGMEDATRRGLPGVFAAPK